MLTVSLWWLSTSLKSSLSRHKKTIRDKNCFLGWVCHNTRPGWNLKEVSKTIPTVTRLSWHVMWFQCSSRQHHGDWWWSDSGSETCGREIENKRVESELEFLWPLKRYLIWLKQGHPAPISFYHDLIKQSSKFKLSARGGRLQNIASFCKFQIEVCQKILNQFHLTRIFNFDVSFTWKNYHFQCVKVGCSLKCCISLLLDTIFHTCWAKDPFPVYKNYD